MCKQLIKKIVNSEIVNKEKKSLYASWKKSELTGRKKANNIKKLKSAKDQEKKL